MRPPMMKGVLLATRAVVFTSRTEMVGDFATTLAPCFTSTSSLGTWAVTFALICMLTSRPSALARGRTASVMPAFFISNEVR